MSLNDRDRRTVSRLRDRVVQIITDLRGVQIRIPELLQRHHIIRPVLHRLRLVAGVGLRLLQQIPIARLRADGQVAVAELGLLHEIAVAILRAGGGVAMADLGLLCDEPHSNLANIGGVQIA